MWFVDGWAHSDFIGGKDDDVFVAQIDQTIKYGTLIDWDDENYYDDNYNKFFQFFIILTDLKFYYKLIKIFLTIDDSYILLIFFIFPIILLS